MKKLFLFTSSLFWLWPVANISQSTPDMRLAKAESALQKEKAAHSKDIEQLKQESQSRIDSLKSHL